MRRVCNAVEDDRDKVRVRIYVERKWSTGGWWVVVCKEVGNV